MSSYRRRHVLPTAELFGKIYGNPSRREPDRIQSQSGLVCVARRLAAICSRDGDEWRANHANGSHEHDGGRDHVNRRRCRQRANHTRHGDLFAGNGWMDAHCAGIAIYLVRSNLQGLPLHSCYSTCAAFLVGPQCTSLPVQMQI